MKIVTSLRIDEEIVNKIKKIAENNHRKYANQIEFILIDYIKKVENQTPQTP